MRTVSLHPWTGPGTGKTPAPAGAGHVGTAGGFVFLGVCRPGGTTLEGGLITPGQATQLAEWLIEFAALARGPAAVDPEYPRGEHCGDGEQD